MNMSIFQNELDICCFVVWFGLELVLVVFRMCLSSPVVIVPTLCTVRLSHCLAKGD